MAVSDPSVLDDAPLETPPPLDWPLLNRLPALLAETQGAAEGCRALLQQAQQELSARFAEEEPVEALVRARARFTDLLLRTLWRQRLPADLAGRLTLVAVGGYGRDGHQSRWQLRGAHDTLRVLGVQQEPAQSAGGDDPAERGGACDQEAASRPLRALPIRAPFGLGRGSFDRPSGNRRRE